MSYAPNVAQFKESGMRFTCFKLKHSSEALGVEACNRLAIAAQNGNAIVN